MAGDDTVKKYVSAKELKERLYQEKDVEVNGKLFRIKRLAPIDFIDTEQIPKLFELADEAKAKNISVHEVATAKVKESPADMLKLIKEGESAIVKSVIIPKMVNKEASLCVDDEVPISYLSNDLSLLMGLMTEIIKFMVGGVEVPFPVKQEQGPADLSNGEPVPPVAQ